jgi:serine/threonine protein kinase/WD40 repeat protein
MSEESSCPVCGVSLSGASSSMGCCPSCLLGVGLVPEEADELAGLELIAEKPGDMVGRYQLIAQVGEGGFGVVFRAEQRMPVRRVVALKVIKPGMDSREVMARFEAERQALALMDHPNIAKVYDAGTTDFGRPYFVMEFVEGRPLTEFCDEQKLALRARLELFIRICEAVQHAHQKGVIHRDLKPANILVKAGEGGEALPKVIDFGVAKAIGVELTEDTFFTMFGRVLGTPLYMSPEQAGLNGVDVDTRSDIYTLGVVLYELLTGRTPLGMGVANFDEIRRRVREEDALRPSARVLSLDPDQRRTTATLRQIDPAKFRRALSGDLDWIVMRAIEKDRGRRYDTANGLGVDIRRYLRGLPVLAGPPGAAYRVSKFVGRNRRSVIASALAFLVLIGVMVVGSKVSRDTKHEKEYSRLLSDVNGVGKWRKEEPGSRRRALATLLRVGDYPLAEIDVEGDRARKLRDAARNELVACLAWTDLQARPLPIDALLDSWGPATLNATHQLCLFSSEDGRLELWDTVKGTLQSSRPSAGSQVKGPLEFSPHGSLVAAGFGTAARWELILWDWAKNTEIETGAVGVFGAFDFHPHRENFVVGTPAGTIELFSGNGVSRRELVDFGERAVATQFSPDGAHLVVALENSGVVVINVESGAREDSWPGQAAVSLAWAPDGQSFVAGGVDGSVTILELGALRPVFTATGEHSDQVDQVTWSSDGRFIASGCRDEIRLWDGRQGELLCHYTGWARNLRFSEGGGTLKEPSLGPVLSEHGALAILDIPKSRACHRAAGHLHQKKITASAWVAGGAVLATAAADGLRLWNREGLALAYRPGVQVHPDGLANDIRYLPDDLKNKPDYLYLATDDGISRSSISLLDGKLQWGKVEVLDANLRDGRQILHSPQVGPLGPFLAVARESEVVLLHPESGARLRSPLPALPSTAFLAISPNGHWLAGGTHSGEHVRIWHLDSPAGAYTDLPVGRASTVAFYLETHHPVTKDPLPPFLMTGNEEAYRLWTVDPVAGGWKQVGQDHLSKMTNSWGRMARMVCSPRGTVAVVTYDRRYLQVLHPITLEVMTQPGFDEQWPLAISPNGQWMATEAPKGRLFIWDLGEVRKELKSLDWPPETLPPYPPNTIPLVMP